VFLPGPIFSLAVVIEVDFVLMWTTKYSVLVAIDRLAGVSLLALPLPANP